MLTTDREGSADVEAFVARFNQTGVRASEVFLESRCMAKSPDPFLATLSMNSYQRSKLTSAGSGRQEPPTRRDWPY